MCEELDELEVLTAAGMPTITVAVHAPELSGTKLSLTPSWSGPAAGALNVCASPISNALPWPTRAISE